MSSGFFNLPRKDIGSATIFYAKLRGSVPISQSGLIFAIPKRMYILSEDNLDPAPWKHRQFYIKKENFPARGYPMNGSAEITNQPTPQSQRFTGVSMDRMAYLPRMYILSEDNLDPAPWQHRQF